MAACQRLRAVLDARRASQLCWRCALSLPRYSSTSASKSVDANAIPYDEILQREVYHMLKSLIPRIRLESTSGSATGSRSVDESEGGSSQTVRNPRIRVAMHGRQGPLIIRALSKKRSIVRRLPSGFKSERSVLEHSDSITKPRIRRKDVVKVRIKGVVIRDRPEISDARSRRIVRRLPSRPLIRRKQAVLASRSVLKHSKTSRKPRIRAAIDAQQAPLVPRTLPEKGKLVPPRIRVAIDGKQVLLVPQTLPKKRRIVHKILLRSRWRKYATLANRSALDHSKAIRKPRIRATVDGQQVPRILLHKRRVTRKIASSQSEHDDLARSVRRHSTSDDRITRRLRGTFAGKGLPSESNLGDNAAAGTKSAAIRKIRIECEKSGSSTTHKDTPRPVVENSQKEKAFKIAIARFRRFLAEKLGARVRLAPSIVINKHPVAPKILFEDHIDGVRTILRSRRIVRRSRNEVLQTKGPGILVAEGDASRLVRTIGTSLSERSTDARGMQSKRSDEVSEDELMSLLDEFENLFPSKPPVIAAETGDLMSTTHSPFRYSHSASKYPEYRRLLLGGSRASNLDVSQRLFSTGATSRPYATAAVSER